MRRNHSAKNYVGITGKMHPEDAGKVGNKLASAALIFAICAGLALLMVAFPWEQMLP